MSKDFVQVPADESVAGAARAMQRSESTEAMVTERGQPVGIITERDILFKVVASGMDPSKAKVREVMSSPVETVDENSKVLEAITKMSKLGIRRLGVTKGGMLVGLVTQKAMVSGPAGHHVVLPELAPPQGLACPYCDARMKDRNELSRHIDQVHLGLGLLEGDKTKW